MITVTLPYPISAKFGLLTVMFRAPNDRFGRTQWQCKCECGRDHIAALFRMTSGHTKSCGCIKGAPKRHGMTRTPTYNTWSGMRARCNNPNAQEFHRYGGRGIRVCERWDESFDAFLADMGEKPPGMSIDRVDNTKGYEPGNCRWATWREQRMNQERMKCKSR